jgi:hypothetical protein
MTPDDFYNQLLVESVYYYEIKALLLEYFGAKRVEIMEHVVKRLRRVENETKHRCRFENAIQNSPFQLAKITNTPSLLQ